MNKQLKNEIFIEGYLESFEMDNKTFQIRNNEELIQFKYNDDFKYEFLEEVKDNEIIKIKGCIDKKDEEIYLLAKDILILPLTEESEE